MRNHYKIILLNSILTHNSAYIIISVLQLTITTDISNLPFLHCAAQDVCHDYSINYYLGLCSKTDESFTLTTGIRTQILLTKRNNTVSKPTDMQPWRKPHTYLAASAQDLSWTDMTLGSQVRLYRLAKLFTRARPGHRHISAYLALNNVFSLR